MFQKKLANKNKEEENESRQLPIIIQSPKMPYESQELTNKPIDQGEIIQVKIRSGETVMNIDCTMFYTILDLKRKIKKETKIPLNNQELYYRKFSASQHYHLVSNQTKLKSVFEKDNYNMILYRPDSGGQIFAKSLTGGTITIVCSFDDTIDCLKQKIQDTANIPIYHQRIIYAGRQLEDGYILKNYGISREATIHLVLRMRGGMFHVTSGRLDGQAPIALTVNIEKQPLNAKLYVGISLENDTPTTLFALLSNDFPPLGDNKHWKMYPDTGLCLIENMKPDAIEVTDNRSLGTVLGDIRQVTFKQE